LRKFVKGLKSGNESDSTRIRELRLNMDSQATEMSSWRVETKEEPITPAINKTGSGNSTRRSKLYPSQLFRLTFGHHIKQYKIGKLNNY
jgi:hypothetical protein